MVEQDPGPPGVFGSAEIWRPSSEADPDKTCSFQHMRTNVIVREFPYQSHLQQQTFPSSKLKKRQSNLVKLQFEKRKPT